MRWKTMVDKKQLEEVYKQNLENDIINVISEMKGIDLRKAFDIYYSSKLAEQISNDSYGIEILKCRLFKKYRTNIRFVLYFFYPE